VELAYPVAAGAARLMLRALGQPQLRSALKIEVPSDGEWWGALNSLLLPDQEPKGRGSGDRATAWARAAVSRRRWCWRHRTS
jgi:hypothetical protein